MATRTLEMMARGGMYDQIGGGFHRYSVDERWLVPHFEKMLYDNAQLARVYLEAYQVTGDAAFRAVAVDVLDYVLREMTAPEGGFYSATDADWEGEEGRFFVWTPAEVREALGDDEAARLFCAAYDVTEAGNFEGHNIPNLPRPLDEVAAELGLSLDALQASLAASRARLYAARARRVAPGLDDKVLTAWNGLMIGAFAEGFRVIGDPRYLDAATRAAAFLRAQLVTADGRLLRTWRAGKAHLGAYLEDYAYLAAGLLDLYEAGGDPAHLREAERLAGRIREDFAAEDGGFYSTARGHESLILRHREGHDGATPAANAVAAHALARLSYHLDREDLREEATRALRAWGKAIARQPRAFATSLAAVDLLLDGPGRARARRAGERPGARGPARRAGAPLPAQPDRRPARSRARRGRPAAPGRQGHGRGVGRAVRLPQLRLPAARHHPGRGGERAGRGRLHGRRRAALRSSGRPASGGRRARSHRRPGQAPAPRRHRVHHAGRHAPHLQPPRLRRLSRRRRDAGAPAGASKARCARASTSSTPPPTTRTGRASGSSARCCGRSHSPASAGARTSSWSRSSGTCRARTSSAPRSGRRRASPSPTSSSTAKASGTASTPSSWPSSSPGRSSGSSSRRSTCASSTTPSTS